MGTRLGPEAPGPLPPLGIASGRCANVQPSLAFPAFLFYPLLGCHFQASAFPWQFISLDLGTVGLRIPFDTLPALFA